EVVGVQDARDVRFAVADDGAVARVTGCLKVRCVDDGRNRRALIALFDRVEELLLHPGNVRVRCFDDEPRAGAELRIRADVAVDDEHVATADVFVLNARETAGFLARDGLRGNRIRIIRDDVGRRLAAGKYAGL